MTITGRRWGKVMLYACDAYPRGAVAPVTFLWHPPVKQHSEEASTGSEEGVVKQPEERRVLWMWCHPASYVEVWNQLAGACALAGNASGNSTSDTDRCNNKDIAMSQPSDIAMSQPSDIAMSQPSDKKTKNDLPQGGTVVQIGQLRLHSLKDQLIKFRLTGPASNLILSQTLKLAKVLCGKECSRTNGEDSLHGNGDARWWQKYYAAEGKEEEFAAQTSSWERIAKCQSPEELPPHAVVALTVRDPRVLLPTVRTKAALDEADSAAEVMTWDHLPSEAAVSPLVDEAVCEEVTKTKMTEQEMNKRRSQVLVPGSILELADEESRIPVVLLQRPGTQSTLRRDSTAMRSGVGGGWDLVAPKGWSMAFWVAMVYRGARVGGLRESQSIATRSAQLYFPHDFPDCPAGQQQQQESRNLSVDKHVRRPPAKRVNYQRLGVPTPFHCPWAQLVVEWQDRAQDILNSNSGAGMQTDTKSIRKAAQAGSDQESLSVRKAEEKPKGEGSETESSISVAGDVGVFSCSPYVLRCRQLLRVFQEAISVANPKGNPRNKGQNLKTRLSVLLSRPLNRMLMNEHLGSLVPVAISCYLRGVPVECAMICLPTPLDLEQRAKDSKSGGPVEHLHPHSKTRVDKAVKKKKKTKLAVKPSSESVNKTQKKQKVQKKTASQKVKESLSAKQLEEKKELMIEPSRVVGTTDRMIIGFLTNGNFDLGLGHGAGVGFCSMAGLLAVLRDSPLNRPLLVLVRNPMSRQYRFANLSLLT